LGIGIYLGQLEQLDQFKYMSNNFKIKLITPSGIAYEGEVVEASLPTPDGQISILKNHMPIITLLSPGEIKIKGGIKEQYLSTEGGVAYISKNFLKILADTAESADSLDMAKIELARKRAEQSLLNARSDVEFGSAQALLEKQLAKIRFIKKRHRQKY